MTIAPRRAIPTNLNSWKEKQLERKIIHFHSRQILEFNSCKKRMFCTYQLHVKQVHRRFWISILRLLSLKREIWPNFFDLSFSAYVVPRRRKQKSENEKNIYQNYLRNLTPKLASCPKKSFKCPALCCFHTIKVPPRAEQSEKNNDFEKPPSQKCSTMASKLDFYILRNTTFQTHIHTHCWHMICLMMHKIYMCGSKQYQHFINSGFLFWPPAFTRRSFLFTSDPK